MKFYRGLVDVGKEPVRHQIKRGFRPSTMTRDHRLVEVKDAKPDNPMSAAEVVVLRFLHGNDRITEMKEVGIKPNLSFAVERDRLEMLYGDKAIEKIFGPRGVGAKLPREIEIEDAYMALEDRFARSQEEPADVDDELIETTDEESDEKPAGEE